METLNLGENADHAALFVGDSQAGQLVLDDELHGLNDIRVLVDSQRVLAHTVGNGGGPVRHGLSPYYCD